MPLQLINQNEIFIHVQIDQGIALFSTNILITLR